MGCKRSEFKEFIENRFGIVIPNDYWVEERRNKVYIYNRELKDLSPPNLARKGLLAGKMKTLYGLKPSLDFVLFFGNLASRNYVQISMEDVYAVYQGNSISVECDCDEGLVILKDPNDKVVGLGYYYKEKSKVKSLIPKNRFIPSS